MVVVGGGFGGLNAARALAGQPVRVTLLDRRNHHLFQPLLYQVATAALNASDIAAPLRSVLRRARNITVLLAEVERVDLAARRLQLDRGELAYDALILATGASDSYFGHEDWEVFAPGLKTLEDALEIRRRVLLAYESAEREQDGAEQKALLTFVVVGGGPTGVELGARVLAAFPESLSGRAQAALERLGVEVRSRATVTRVTADAVWLGGRADPRPHGAVGSRRGRRPACRTLGVELDRSGRVPVEPDLSLPGHPEVFVIGDMSLCRDDKGAPLPGLAPVATQQGSRAADNVLRHLRGRPTRPFRYRDRGTMATIGRAKAVAVIGGVKLSGLVAWLAWLFVHIMFLIGFRNRFLVLFEWAWAYVTWQRGARLITGPIGALPPVKAIAPDGQPALPEVARIVSLDPEAREQRAG